MISNSDYKIFQNLTSSLNRRNIICTHTFRNIKCQLDKHFKNNFFIELSMQFKQKMKFRTKPCVTLNQVKLFNLTM